MSDLEANHGKFVKEHRGKMWLGAWFREEDWDKEGRLIATGEDRLRALDPWANDRAQGRPCPPLGSSGTPDWADYVKSGRGMNGPLLRPSAKKLDEVAKLVPSATKPVTETSALTVTKTTSSSRKPVTKISSVTETRHGGRPLKEKALTAAERAKRYRARQADKPK